MYERVPITGIRESHRFVEGPRTVVMPLLITTLLAGLIGFYFHGEPRSPISMASAALPDSQAAEAKAPTTSAPNQVSVPLAAPNAPQRDLPIVARADVPEKDFTSWMSPQALDSYLRQKNRGYQGNFWSRGNWIRAIEGRWHEGTREIRIALGTMTERGRIEWAYRINLTEIAFAEELARKGNEGFILAQSQAYRHPDGTKRYQAVWQKEDPKQAAR